jgi:polar amino acid transport system substrate-binding protein
MSRITNPRWVVLGLALAAGVVLLAGYLFRDRSLEQVLEAGAIRVGYAVEAPYAFLTPGGEVTGQSPELVRLIAARLGIPRVEWRLTEFGALIGELLDGRFDLVAAGMFITPERAKRVRFSEPVFRVGQGLLVAPGNPLGLHSYQGAVDEGGRIAVLTGSVEEALLRRMGLAPPLLVPAPDVQTGRAAVEAGLADALALSSPSLRWMSMEEPLVRCRMAWPFEQPDPALTGPMGYGAFVFRPGEEALARVFDRAIRDILPGPEYRNMALRFGFTDLDSPGNKTTREILSR